MDTGCCFSCSRRGIAKRVEATFSRYLLFRDYAPVPGDLHLGRLRIPALSFGAKYLFSSPPANLTFDNCPQGLKPRFMRSRLTRPLKGRSSTAMQRHGDARARRCAWILSLRAARARTPALQLRSQPGNWD